MMLLNERHQLLANFATEIPRDRRVRGARERSNLEGVLPGVGDLENINPAIPVSG